MSRVDDLEDELELIRVAIRDLQTRASEVQKELGPLRRTQAALNKLTPEEMELLKVQFDAGKATQSV